jgi:hypothetical protein
MAKKKKNSVDIERFFYSIFGIEKEYLSSDSKRDSNRKFEEDISEEEIKEIIEGIEAEKEGRVSELDISKL